VRGATARVLPVSGAARGEPDFEEIYARAGSELGSVPWASLAPHPALVAWLEQRPEAVDQAGLVVGCGLGDDAEAVSNRGYRVSAFDIAPSAVARCRERFPASAVDYQVADLLALPGAWQASFDLVIEVRTLQSMPLEQRPCAVAAIAATVRRGGLLWVRCLARDAAEAVTTRPWPVSRRELLMFQDAGLCELDFHEQGSAVTEPRSFTAVYRRDGNEVVR
jgi:SAM-dependent methyltransferase